MDVRTAKESEIEHLCCGLASSDTAAMRIDCAIPTESAADCDI
jgi:hypothetical protein